MAQSDQQVDNLSFPAFRTDLNDNLAALFSQSSGNSAPGVTVAFQPWIDTSSSPAVWKVRNGTNTGWITIGTIDATTFSTGGITAIANGGTGATTATAALAALLPSQTGNSGKALVTDGSLAAWGLVASGISVQVFTSSGTYTPTTGKTTALVAATGGGGGYVGSSPGGGGGGTGFRVYSAAELGTSASVTVGSAGGSYANGGTSSFDPAGTGVTLSGAGGTYGSGSSYGLGGGATNAQFSSTANGGYTTGSYGSFWGGGYGKGGTSSNLPTAGVVIILEW